MTRNVSGADHLESRHAARRAPSAAHVIRAIVARELRAASKRRFVRWLFVISLLPLIVIATFLVVRVFLESQIGKGLGWDPVLAFFQFQAFPVALLGLGLGTPIVAQDRAEDVLFLYATRPVTPIHYTLGKLLAVAVPTAGLLVLPGLGLAALRLGLLESVGLMASLVLLGKVVVAGLLISLGYAGVAVGASALTGKTRWAILFALGMWFVPDAIGAATMRGESFLGLGGATDAVLRYLFATGSVARGIGGGIALAAFGSLGAVVIALRVRGEMTP